VATRRDWPEGTNLSAGQRQRIALARSLYRNPFLVVLDEPNSNLDTEGELALVEAIRGVRQRGGIVVIIAHRPIALGVVDFALMMNQGRVQGFGPRDGCWARCSQVACGAQPKFEWRPASHPATNPLGGDG
jgi:ATP-binding cassette subfamily C protein